MIGLLLKNCFIRFLTSACQEKNIDTTDVFLPSPSVAPVSVSAVVLWQNYLLLLEKNTFVNDHNKGFGRKTFLMLLKKVVLSEHGNVLVLFSWAPKRLCQGRQKRDTAPAPWWMINPIIWTCKKSTFCKSLKIFATSPFLPAPQVSDCV